MNNFIRLTDVTERLREIVLNTDHILYAIPLPSAVSDRQPPYPRTRIFFAADCEPMDVTIDFDELLKLLP
jgi:hypothetical protein